MKISQPQKLAIVLMTLSLTACEEQALQAVGQLESDRVELVAESNEPIIAIEAIEGDRLIPGDVVLVQDSQRLLLRQQELQAALARQQAVLEELGNGPRAETITAMRASLREAQVEFNYRQRETERQQGLLARQLTSAESAELAEMQMQRSAARIDQLQAQLDELLAGTRSEQLDQARSQLTQIEAQLQSMQFDLERLNIKAPVAGLLDSLPFETGERPRVGSVVAVLLTGEQPYARVYIPEPLRVSISPGMNLQVHVDGLEQTLTGTVRRISSEASFTPYFALTERDRSRLSYVAEITLPASEQRLPEGLPVQILFD